MSPSTSMKLLSNAKNALPQLLSTSLPNNANVLLRLHSSLILQQELFAQPAHFSPSTIKQQNHAKDAMVALLSTLHQKLVMLAQLTNQFQLVSLVLHAQLVHSTTTSQINVKFVLEE